MTTLAGRASPAPRPADPFLPRPFVVRDHRQDTRDTYTLVLEPVDEAPLEFAAGQFTMMHAFGVGEAPISISGDPARSDRLEHTIRNVGAVTRALVHAAPGTELGIRGPFGTGWEVSSGSGGDVVFVAGGIGLAPLRPAILEVCAARARYGRVLLLYGARTPEDILYGDDLRRWAQDHDIDVQVTVDNGQHAWRGRVGLVTQLITRGGFDAANTLALVCGPEVMMRYAAMALADRGVPPSRLRLSMERNMKCGVGLCGHCQLREHFLCVDGPVLTYAVLEPLMSRAEL
ncbi:FAD/NAD(P)-binding protein [Pedococcus bigeumensis]|uniref:FAD/NAD(P)-binding protein n=1 Tax=Pedococcus bigeumensis TaxID=433644 RepID=UPI002FE74991